MKKTKNSSKTSAALAMLAFLFVSLAGPAAAEQVGFVASVAGQVEIRNDGATSWQAAVLDADVERGDVFRTGPDSAVKLVMNDDTTLSIGPDTELRIDEYVIGSGTPDKRSVLQLVRGHIRAWIGELFGGPSRVEMHTPTAVIGVKGTAYDVWVTESAGEISTIVCVTHGAITARAAGAPPGAAQEFPMGVCVRVGPDGKVTKLQARPGENRPLDPQVFDQGKPAFHQTLISTEGLVVPQPPVGLAPDPPEGSEVSVSLVPQQANEEPLLQGEDPLWKHDWFEDPILALSVRDHAPIIPDEKGKGCCPGSNLQLFRFEPFFNFDTQQPDVRVFIRELEGQPLPPPPSIRDEVRDLPIIKGEVPPSVDPDGR